jgi:hypothetical protein
MFSQDDPLIMGSEITIDSSSLSWTRRTSSDFTSDPIVLESDKPMFAKAMGQFGINPSTVGAILHWECGNGTNWGPAADHGSRMQVANNGRLVMGWYDGLMLLLVRR